MTIQHQTHLSFTSSGRGLMEITEEVRNWLSTCQVNKGLLTLFVQHTSASLVIQENADPDVLHDLEMFFKKLVPDTISLYRHSSEGSDDMPAHIRSALTQVQLSIPVLQGRMQLGTWQGIYLYEHRTRPHRRKICAHFIGD
ncbi:MAG: YjbQ family protein [Nitrospinae bacterium]|nr:YjbQ family protein [Nitrospinota bacterium]